MSAGLRPAETPQGVVDSKLPFRQVVKARDFDSRIRWFKSINGSQKNKEEKNVKAKYEPMVNLKIMRIKNGMTQEELARKANISAVLVSLYERGQNFPRKGTLDALAKALNCDVRDII